MIFLSYLKNYMIKVKQIILTEYQECVVFVEYLNLKNIKFSHIHQEMWTPSFNQKRKAKCLGVNSGVPDYIICLPNVLLFCEMKRIKKSVVSPTQKEWIKALNDIGGSVEAIVCKGADEAIEEIEKRLK